MAKDAVYELLKERYRKELEKLLEEAGDEKRSGGKKKYEIMERERRIFNEMDREDRRLRGEFKELGRAISRKLHKGWCLEFHD